MASCRSDRRDQHILIVFRFDMVYIEYFKILGQIDVSTGQVVEKYLKAVREQLEGGNAPQIHNIDIGQVVIVR